MAGRRPAATPRRRGRAGSPRGVPERVMSARTIPVPGPSVSVGRYIAAALQLQPDGRCPRPPRRAGLDSGPFNDVVGAFARKAFVAPAWPRPAPLLLGGGQVLGEALCARRRRRSPRQAWSATGADDREVAVAAKLALRLEAQDLADGASCATSGAVERQAGRDLLGRPGGPAPAEPAWIFGMALLTSAISCSRRLQSGSRCPSPVGDHEDSPPVSVSAASGDERDDRVGAA